MPLQENNIQTPPAALSSSCGFNIKLTGPLNVFLINPLHITSPKQNSWPHFPSPSSSPQVFPISLSGTTIHSVFQVINLGVILFFLWTPTSNSFVNFLDFASKIYLNYVASLNLHCYSTLSNSHHHLLPKPLPQPLQRPSKSYSCWHGTQSKLYNSASDVIIIIIIEHSQQIFLVRGMLSFFHSFVQQRNVPTMCLTLYVALGPE